MDALAQLVRDRDERIRAHAELRASAPFREQETLLNRLTYDFLSGIRMSWTAATRNKFNVDNSLVLRRADDFLESALSIQALVAEGMHNPARREKRYVIEALMKYLVADETMWNSSFDERLAYFEKTLNRERVSIVAGELRLSMLEESSTQELQNEIRSEYARLCAYVHPSLSQLRERTENAARGNYAGFDTVEQFRRVNRDLSRFFDICLALFLHAVGPPETGDAYIQLFDDMPKWKYHRTKYMRQVSAFFDYKIERKARPRPR